MQQILLLVLIACAALGAPSHPALRQSPAQEPSEALVARFFQIHNKRMGTTQRRLLGKSSPVFLYVEYSSAHHERVVLHMNVLATMHKSLGVALEYRWYYGYSQSVPDYTAANIQSGAIGTKDNFFEYADIVHIALHRAGGVTPMKTPYTTDGPMAFYKLSRAGIYFQFEGVLPSNAYDGGTWAAACDCNITSNKPGLAVMARGGGLRSQPDHPGTNVDYQHTWVAFYNDHSTADMMIYRN
ncbi:hypothetical protein H257_15238 [Aphanomyces astaci]|uniref:Uncharacterized protein n=1 Tax=Aphanomyces astaci TaxID=112090 RepID=W4FN32_APHAT|nr:hypothetical protein H257_15238 [Aphanomyces astaci]ETV68885.1 hypothetical protein H257_15238 [Aphanomyces astaci]|eukprot:XP_009841562.1 hypothetical protein H257_15238 [Aphanomyces astaci]